MDYYSAIKRNEVAMCYNVMLENIMLSERNQKHKVMHVLGFHLQEISRIGKPIKAESRLVVA